MGRRRVKLVEVVVALGGEEDVVVGMERGDVVGGVDVGVLARRVVQRGRLPAQRRQSRRQGLRALEQWVDCCRELKR